MSRHLSILLILALQAFAGDAAAGPVPVAEAHVGTSDARTTPGLSDQPLNDGTAAPAAAAASGSALAMEIIKETEAGTAAVDAPRRPGGESASAVAQPAVPRARGNPSDDPRELRDMGKSAVQWLREAVPWLRNDEDTRDDGQGTALDAAEWSASPLDGGQAGRGARLASSQPPVAAAGMDPATVVGYGDAARPLGTDPEQNAVRVVIKVLREVLEHPMTWLVLSLFVIGGLVIKKIDRRPTK